MISVSKPFCLTINGNFKWGERVGDFPSEMEIDEKPEESEDLHWVQDLQL